MLSQDEFEFVSRRLSYGPHLHLEAVLKGRWFYCFIIASRHGLHIRSLGTMARMSSLTTVCTQLREPWIIQSPNPSNESCSSSSFRRLTSAIILCKSSSFASSVGVIFSIRSCFLFACRCSLRFVRSSLDAVFWLQAGVSLCANLVMSLAAAGQKKWAKRTNQCPTVVPSNGKTQILVRLLERALL